MKRKTYCCDASRHIYENYYFRLNNCLAFGGKNNDFSGVSFFDIRI